MGAKDWDDMIKRALMEGTGITPEVKEGVWKGIDNELYADEKGEEIITVKRNNWLVSLVASAAAIVILVVGLQTQPGHALVNRIIEMFTPEKNITQDIEGVEEEQDVKLNEGREASYAIYVDEERYVFIKAEQGDRIIPKTPLDERYPEVSMEIKQVKDKKPEELVMEMEKRLKEDFTDVSAPAEVQNPLSGWMVRGLAGNRWDSRLVKVYVVSNQRQGSFVITQRYFLEAEEGHGARFDHMLREFHIVDDNDM